MMKANFYILKIRHHLRKERDTVKAEFWRFSKNGNEKRIDCPIGLLRSLAS